MDKVVKNQWGHFKNSLHGKWPCFEFEIPVFFPLYQESLFSDSWGHPIFNASIVKIWDAS